MNAIERQPSFLSPREAAQIAGLSTRAIYRAIQRGELRAWRQGSGCTPPSVPHDADGIRTPSERARRPFSVRAWAVGRDDSISQMGSRSRCPRRSAAL